MRGQTTPPAVEWAIAQLAKYRHRIQELMALFQYSELVAMQRLPLATTPPGDLLQEFMALL